MAGCARGREAAQGPDRGDRAGGVLLDGDGGGGEVGEHIDRHAGGRVGAEDEQERGGGEDQRAVAEGGADELIEHATISMRMAVGGDGGGGGGEADRVGAVGDDTFPFFEPRDHLDPRPVPDAESEVPFLEGFPCDVDEGDEATAVLDECAVGESEGVGGLSRKDQIAEIPVELTPATSAMVQKAEADDDEEKRKEAARKLRLAASKIDRTAAASRKIKGRTVVMATRSAARKAGKRANVRFASASAGRAR